MTREVVEPTSGDHGEERHPAWGLIGAYRTQQTPGAVLFDSDIRHQHTVTLRISTASRRRDLHHDRAYAEKQFVEIQMSEAQWASFVSSMNVGDGVPCTIRRRDGAALPEMPHEPRIRESMDEVRSATAEQSEKVLAALEVYKGHKTVGNLRSLEATIRNLPANLVFAGESLAGHAENVVQRARADIEAMVTSRAQQLGLDPSDLGITPQLEKGD